jgi:hypothetical protein
MELTRNADPGVLELHLLFRNPLSDLQKLGWHEVMQSFIDLARSGALSGSSIAPARSGGILEQGRLDDREGYWRIRRTILDPSAFTPLVNLCHFAHLNVSAIEQLSLYWREAPAGDSVETFPAAWPQLSFELTEHELTGQTVAIELEFREPQAANVRERINKVIGDWFAAAGWGAYADDQFPLPGSTVILAPQVMTTNELGITWYIEEFFCSDAVFHGLVNCLERISLTLAPIRRVTVGE